MPRIYMTPAELQETPLGIGLSSIISQLGTNVLDKLLARASELCDTYTEKRLQAPGTTTLANSPIAGATSLQLTSTLTLDNRDEQALLLNSGAANQEIIVVQSGGVSVTSWASPYPGTIALASPLQSSHTVGESVQFLYKEVTEAGSASSSDPYTEALETQTAQLALAHLPPARNTLTRVVFLRNSPIININLIEHAYSFTNQFNTVDLTIETIVPTEGWYRFNVGAVVLREGAMRTTYTAGYQVIPDDIKVACSYYFADQFKQFLNPYGLNRLQMGKRGYGWGMSKDGTSQNVLEARSILKKYRRLV